MGKAPANHHHHDACMKLSASLLTQQRLRSTRPQLEIGVDLVPTLLKLSIPPPISLGRFPGPIVVGAGGAAGTSPDWAERGNRVSKKSRKSGRGLGPAMQGKVSYFAHSCAEGGEHEKNLVPCSIPRMNAGVCRSPGPFPLGFGRLILVCKTDKFSADPFTRHRQS